MNPFGRNSTQPESTVPSFGSAGHAGDVPAAVASTPVQSFGFGRNQPATFRESPSQFGQVPLFGAQKRPAARPRSTFVFGGAASKPAAAEHSGGSQPAASFIFGKPALAAPPVSAPASFPGVGTTETAEHAANSGAAPSWSTRGSRTGRGTAETFFNPKAPCGEVPDSEVFDLASEKAKALSNIPSFSGAPAASSIAKRSHVSPAQPHPRLGIRLSKNQEADSPSMFSRFPAHGRCLPSPDAMEEGEVLRSPQTSAAFQLDAPLRKATASPFRDRVAGLQQRMTGRSPPTTDKDDGQDLSEIGLCEEMCPALEMEIRSEYGDIDLAERIDPADPKKGTSRDLAVKRFERTMGPDQLRRDRHSLRTRAALEKTMYHLLSLLDHKVYSFSRLHKFLWDRYRGVRQDLNTQGMKDEFAAWCFEQTIRYSIICEHELCGSKAAVQDIEGYDSHLNKEQLAKALVSLMEVYDNLYALGRPAKNEATFRAYQILVTMGTHGKFAFDSIEFVITLRNLRTDLINSPQIRQAMALHTAYRMADYVHFFKLAESASYLVACLAHLYFDKARFWGLRLLTQKGSKGMMPLHHIADLLMLDDEEEAKLLCMHYGLSVAYSTVHPGVLVLDRSKDMPALQTGQAEDIQSPSRSSCRKISLKRSQLYRDDVLPPDHVEEAGGYTLLRNIAQRNKNAHVVSSASTVDQPPIGQHFFQPAPQETLSPVAIYATVSDAGHPTQESVMVAGDDRLRQQAKEERLRALAAREDAIRQDQLEKEKAAAEQLAARMRQAAAQQAAIEEKARQLAAAQLAERAERERQMQQAAAAAAAKAAELKRIEAEREAAEQAHRAHCEYVQRIAAEKAARRTSKCRAAILQLVFSRWKRNAHALKTASERKARINASLHNCTGSTALNTAIRATTSGGDIDSTEGRYLPTHSLSLEKPPATAFSLQCEDIDFAKVLQDSFGRKLGTLDFHSACIPWKLFVMSGMPGSLGRPKDCDVPLSALWLRRVLMDKDRSQEVPGDATPHVDLLSKFSFSMYSQEGCLSVHASVFDVSIDALKPLDSGTHAFWPIACCSGILMLVDGTATSAASQLSHRLSAIFKSMPKGAPRLPVSILSCSEAADSAARRGLQIAVAAEDSLHLRFDFRVFRLPLAPGPASAPDWNCVLKDSLQWMIDSAPTPPQLQQKLLSQVVKDELDREISAPLLGDTTWAQSALETFDHCLDRAQSLLESATVSPAAAWGWPAKEWLDNDAAAADDFTFLRGVGFEWWKPERLSLSRAALAQCKITPSPAYRTVSLDVKRECENLRTFLAACGHAESQATCGLSWGFAYELRHLQLQLYSLLYSRLTSLEDVPVVTTTEGLQHQQQQQPVQIPKFLPVSPKGLQPTIWKNAEPHFLRGVLGLHTHRRYSSRCTAPGGGAENMLELAQSISPENVGSRLGMGNSLKALQASLHEENYLAEQLMSGLMAEFCQSDNRLGHKRLRELDCDDVLARLHAERKRELAVTQDIVAMSSPQS